MSPSKANVDIGPAVTVPLPLSIRTTLLPALNVVPPLTLSVNPEASLGEEPVEEGEEIVLS